MKCVMIILNYKDVVRAGALAKKCASYQCIDKVIIVDNASGDGSYEKLLFIANERIEVIASEKNSGFATGNNLGMKYAVRQYNPKWILLANTDTIFSEEDVQACLDELARRDDLGLISMRMVDMRKNEERSAWKFRSYWGYLLFNIWIYKHLTYKNDSYNNFAEHFQYVDIVRGSFMCFRTVAIEKAGYLDEGIFLYYEEEIVSIRLSETGYKVGLLTDRFYVHNHIYTGTSNRTFSQKNLDKDLDYFLSKYYHIKIIQLALFKVVTCYAGIETAVISFVKHQ